MKQNILLTLGILCLMGSILTLNETNMFNPFIKPVISLVFLLSGIGLISIYIENNNPKI
jgi:hypothetical protein